MTTRRERLAAARLYVLATTAISRGPLLSTVEQALLGGATMIQLREKSMSDAETLDLARRLRVLCDAHGALLIVNDRVEIARDAGADGVHLGQDDRPVADARRILGPQALVGVSTHDAEELRRALADGADHVGVGSVFATSTKGRAVPVSGPAALAPVAAAAEAAGVPAFAIGGITPANVAEVAAAGFRRIAVSAGVLAAESPRAAAAALVAALG
ncbi:MAG: thiamine phosphate synthase [Planctomycetes bacterium]|nr:thiamine phosphate synthase [Planctomycetota bacterium]